MLDFMLLVRRDAGVFMGLNDVKFKKVGLGTQPLLHAIRTQFLGTGNDRFVVLLKPNLRWRTWTRGTIVYAGHIRPLDRCRSVSYRVWVLFVLWILRC